MTALLTLADVARQLAVSPYTVRRLIRRGDLACHRIGGEYRVHPDDLAAYLEATRIQSTVERRRATIRALPAQPQRRPLRPGYWGE